MRGRRARHAQQPESGAASAMSRPHEAQVDAMWPGTVAHPAVQPTGGVMPRKRSSISGHQALFLPPNGCVVRACVVQCFTCPVDWWASYLMPATSPLPRPAAARRLCQLYLPTAAQGSRAAPPAPQGCLRACHLHAAPRGRAPAAAPAAVESDRCGGTSPHCRVVAAVPVEGAPWAVYHRARARCPICQERRPASCPPLSARLVSNSRCSWGLEEDVAVAEEGLVTPRAQGPWAHC
jgi:hypothetical protein